MLVCFTLALCASACGPRLIYFSDNSAESIPATQASSSPADFDWSDYALCLRSAVRDDGVDYTPLLNDPAPLDRALSRLARRGPNLMPQLLATSADRTAYWINAYNAAVLRGVVELIREHRGRAGPQAMPDRQAQAVETSFAFVIDGQKLRPADLRRRALDSAGDDWRVRFALCNGRVVGPGLQRHPFLGDVLDTQLDDAVRGAMARPGVVRIDHGEQQLVIWRGLAELRALLVNDFRRRTGAPDANLFNVLIEWAAPEHRRLLNRAVGYDEVLMPDDNRINHAGRPEAL